MGLRRADRLSFLQDPLGRLVVGRTFIVWCAGDTLSGTLFWGAPDAADAAAVGALWEYDPHLGYCDSIIDASRVTRVEPAAFQTIAAWAQPRIRGCAEHIRRQVVIAPRDEIGGALVAGLPLLLGLRHPWRVFFDENDGLAWLARPEVDEVYGQLRLVAAQAFADGAALGALRAHLTANPNAPSLYAVARSLGRSARSLQRDLRRSGASFREEVRAARIRAAADRLLSSGDKLEAIAASVGYSSLSHFGEAFVAVMGVTPLAFRRGGSAAGAAATSAATSSLRR
jgi:AraC-like DNA-binding protein